MEDETLSFFPRVFLSFTKGLDTFVDITADHLAIRGNETILVIGVESHDFAGRAFGWSGFLQQKIHEESWAVPAKTDRFADNPSIGDLAVEMTSTPARNHHPRRARTNQSDGVVKRTRKRFDGAEVGKECHCVPTDLWFLLSLGRADHLLGLFGKRLGKSSGNLKAISAKVDGGKVCQSRGEILSLPKEVHEVLSDIVASTEEVSQCSDLARVEIVEENAGRAAHSWNGKSLVGFEHLVPFWDSRFALLLDPPTRDEPTPPLVLDGWDLTGNSLAAKRYSVDPQYSGSRGNPKSALLFCFHSASICSLVSAVKNFVDKQGTSDEGAYSGRNGPKRED